MYFFLNKSFIRLSTVLLLIIFASANSPSYVFSQEAQDVPSDVIAEIDGRKITIDDINKLIKLLPEDLQPRYSNMKLKKAFINDYLDTEVLYTEGVKKNIEKDPEFILRVESIRRALARDIYIKNYVVKDMQVSEKDISEYYKEHKEEFKNDDYAIVSHILLNSNDEAERIKKLISEDKIPFPKAAKEYSIDKITSSKGGKIGLIYKNRAIPGYAGSEAMVNKLFSMNEKQIAGPFKSDVGFHIVKVWNIKRGKYLTLDEVRGKIGVLLNQEKTITVIKKDIERLKKKYNVKVYKDNFK